MWLPVTSWVFVFGVNLWFVRRGLSKGIEKFCSWAMPAMAVCALVVLVRVLTLGTPDPAAPEQNVLAGLGYMWNPNFSKLADFKTWLAAAGQVFFTLSVGFGIIINYASYMKPDDDVALSGLTAAATNELFEVGFGGMITLTAAFIFLGLSGTTAAVVARLLQPRLHHAAHRVRPHGAVRQPHRGHLVPDALPGGDHQLAVDVPARRRPAQGGPGPHPRAGDARRRGLASRARRSPSGSRRGARSGARSTSGWGRS